MLTARLNARLDGLAAEHADEVKANVEDLLATVVATTRVTSVGEDVGVAPEMQVIATHSRDVARDAQRTVDSVKEGVGKAWFQYLVAKDPAPDIDAIRVRCAAALRVDGVVSAVEATATEWVGEQLDRYRVEIKNMTGLRRDEFIRVQEQTSSPEVVTVRLRANERAATKDSDGNDLPRLPGHVFSDADGLFPVSLNAWESQVMEAELARAGFVAWYRNPGSATPASLRIAYQNEAGEWASLQPDFIVVSRRSDGSLAASIIDPHGDYLADARGKLHALARFAENHGDKFVRIESIAKADDGSLRVLDLTDPAVRAAVLAFDGAKVSGLYLSSDTRPFA